MSGLSGTLKDLRFALRRLLRRPLFTLTALVSLAIGIGANTSAFTVVNTVLLRDLPLAQPEQLVEVYHSMPGFSHATVSFPDYEDVRDNTGDVFSEVGGTRIALVQTLQDGAVDSLPAELVSGNYFTLQGVPAVAGRTLLPEDDIKGGARQVVVLGHGFWQRRYNGDPGVVGETLELNGRDYEIVGVVHPEYTGYLLSLLPDVYAPLNTQGHLQPGETDETISRSNSSIFLKARMHEGVTQAEAQVAMERVLSDLKTNHPDQWLNSHSFQVVPTLDVIVNPMIDPYVKAAMTLLLAVVALVLLIACANLASFLLAQMTDRRKEIALRLALGVNRGRLVRQLVTESLVLAALGGLLGVICGQLALRALLRADLPLPFPMALDLNLDWRVALFSIATVVLAGLFFGLLPALRASRPDVASTLKDETVAGRAGRGFKPRNLLVVAQVAISMLLLLGAGLFLRSLSARAAVDPGFGDNPAAIVTLQIPAQTTEGKGRAFQRELVERVEALPTVNAAGIVGDLHLSPLNNWTSPIEVAGIAPPPDEPYHQVDWTTAAPGYLEAAGIRILEGENFERDLSADSAPVAIISEALAQRFYPAGNALHNTFRQRDEEVRIVGIAEDTKVRSLGEPPRAIFYRPAAQRYNSFFSLVASTDQEPDRVASQIVEIGRELNAELLIYEKKSMERHLAVGLLPYRLSALMLTGFGLIALLLASVGLYGVVNFAVSHRLREVGIRMSLGATPRSVLALLIRGGLIMAAVGGAIGLVLAMFGARLLGNLIYGVAAIDPVTFLLVPLVLGTVAFLAAFLPAWRASRADPVRALRS